MSDYILVKKEFRPSDPAKSDYIDPDSFYNMMYDSHGLMIEFFSYYSDTNLKLDPKLYCFKIIDKGKALKFSILYSDFVEMPNKY
jgi:hypothetical protein